MFKKHTKRDRSRQTTPTQQGRCVGSKSIPSKQAKGGYKERDENHQLGCDKMPKPWQERGAKGKGSTGGEGKRAPARLGGRRWQATRDWPAERPVSKTGGWGHVRDTVLLRDHDISRHGRNDYPRASPDLESSINAASLYAVRTSMTAYRFTTAHLSLDGLRRLQQPLFPAVVHV